MSLSTQIWGMFSFKVGLPNQYKKWRPEDPETLRQQIVLNLGTSWMGGQSLRTIWMCHVPCTLTFLTLLTFMAFMTHGISYLISLKSRHFKHITHVGSFEHFVFLYSCISVFVQFRFEIQRMVYLISVPFSASWWVFWTLSLMNIWRQQCCKSEKRAAALLNLL